MAVCMKPSKNSKLKAGVSKMVCTDVDSSVDIPFDIP